MAGGTTAYYSSQLAARIGPQGLMPPLPQHSHIQANSNEEGHSSQVSPGLESQSADSIGSISQGEKFYDCPHCNFQGISPRHLSSHKRKHFRKKPYACIYCEYRCSDSSSLDIHKRVHTREKPFACPHCDYKSAGSSSLIVHLRVHTGERPYLCEHCDYKAADSSSLARHRRVHTKEKPFSCPMCDYKAAHSNNLTRHLLVHTGEKPFSCRFCDYKAAQYSLVVQHEMRHLDDIVLLGESKINLQKKINVLRKYFEDNFLTLNQSKSKVMVFRNGGRKARSDVWFWGQLPLTITSKYTYLGYQLTASNSTGGKAF
ncbi:hypothetical protein LAZ67_3003653 [Cordylochernes scorpioides]|uniref:C2H2-type domain-containing protein n=1 Tax=Cordylochernes scorpioides TaxID=51811 RepID=A0ABY6K985_9ARAC|nr:hypothetical protein LAZ67_3003653 [Cordylochernes scorpioides]